MRGWDGELGLFFGFHPPGGYAFFVGFVIYLFFSMLFGIFTHFFVVFCVLFRTKQREQQEISPVDQSRRYRKMKEE